MPICLFIIKSFRGLCPPPPLAPLPGLCPGPTGCLKRPPDPSPNNFAPLISGYGHGNRDSCADIEIEQYSELHLYSISVCFSNVTLCYEY